MEKFDINAWTEKFIPFIQQTFRSHGFIAENPDIEIKDGRAEVYFDTEATSGTMGFFSKVVTCRARFGLPENASRQLVANADLSISYQNRDLGSNGNSIDYIYVFETKRGGLEKIVEIRKSDFHRMSSAMYFLHREKCWR
jgi:hypothetical protein